VRWPRYREEWWAASGLFAALWLVTIVDPLAGFFPALMCSFVAGRCFAGAEGAPRLFAREETTD
jgi:hypothetical protein